jgi:glycosyltransferase involved in cell wall biosynthesis
MAATTRMESILLSSSQLQTGGVQTVIDDLAGGLEQSGRRICFVHQASLPQLRMVESANQLGYRSFGCPMPVLVRHSVLLTLLIVPIYLPVALFHLARLIRRERVSIVNCHYLEPYFVYLVVAARLMRRPVFVSVHGADVEDYQTLRSVEWFACRLAMRCATQIIGCSKSLAQQAAEACPEVRDKVTFIHNALRPIPRQPVITPRVLPKRFVLCVSRHVRKKGIDVLLRSFATIAADVADVSLVIVGGGPLFEDHRSLADSLGVDERVVFVDSVPHAEVKAFIEACELFVLPSRAEPFGLVILEAASSGKPIVATCVGGVPEILSDGVNGILVSPDDPAALAAQIIRLLRSPEVAARLGAEANGTLPTRFAWTKWVRDYLDVFEAAIKSRHCQRANVLPSHGDSECVNP